MFPQLRQRIGPALDLIVEFSTLGEYRLDVDGVLRPASAFAHAPERVPQLGGAGESLAGRAAVRRIVAGGAAGLAPAVTPAARRLGRDVAAAEAAARVESARHRPAQHEPAPREPACRGERRHARAEHAAPRPKPRPRVAAVGEQLCLAI
jgi:hypothetical protein